MIIWFFLWLINLWLSYIVYLLDKVFILVLFEFFFDVMFMVNDCYLIFLEDFKNIVWVVIVGVVLVLCVGLVMFVIICNEMICVVKLYVFK